MGTSRESFSGEGVSVGYLTSNHLDADTFERTQRAGNGRYGRPMSAQPIEDTPPYDPAVILRALPADKRAHFLSLYEQAVGAARRPDQYRRLYELLHIWWLKAEIYRGDPGFDRTPEEILAGLGDGVPLNTAILDWEQRLRAARRR